MSVNSRLEPYTIIEIESLLLAQEVRLKKYSKLVAGDKMTINIAISEDKSGSSSKANQDTNKQGGFRGGNHFNTRGRRNFDRSRGRGN